MIRHRGGLFGVIILLLFAAAAIFAPWLSQHDPLVGTLANAREGPSPEHLLGTDELGRDMLARLLHGGRATLSVGAIAVVIGLAIGVPVGSISGYLGGRLDLFVQRFVDALMAFPGILLAILVVGVLGPGLDRVMIAVGIVSIPTYTRLVRGSVLSVKHQPFIEAARAVGQRNGRILLLHVMPNSLSPLIVQSTLQFAMSLLAAAGLGFLGLGAQPPAPEWGASLASARGSMRTAPHLVLVPGVAITVVVLALNLVGDALRDALDPRLRRGGA